MSEPVPVQTCAVFAADDLYVRQGVAQGDGLTGPEDVCTGDVYWLDPDALPRHLSFLRDGQGQRVAPGSEVGRPGETVIVRARYRLLGPEGDGVDVLLLDVGGDLFALPLAPVVPRADHTLVTVDATPAALPLADLMSLSFARGTRVTMGDGSQRPVETLRPGDLVLTRDHGRQPLRWLGQATLRAVGAFAPVVIGKGTLGNADDLAVGPHHRIFLYLRRRDPALPTAEVLVQARHLIDGEAVWAREGGFVDYFGLVFDRHEIIYAEGIPVESLLVNEATVPRLPAGLADEVTASLPGLRQSQHFGTEADTRAMAAIAGMLGLGAGQGGGR
ncbi:MAG: Hint domain-containing protein [Paracoccaceae bacterium]|nr:MAG: Hint domain-containing protein [Paracoccaceae bacterium]